MNARERVLIAKTLTRRATLDLADSLDHVITACDALGLTREDPRRAAVRAAYETSARANALLSQMLERIPQ